MSEFLLVSAAIVLVAVAAGLGRVLRGPGDAERIMAAQLLGTGGVAALLLFGAASGIGAAVDLALTLALLAAFATIAFVKKGTTHDRPGPDAREPDGERR
jgi:multicomponent Na+:H+ antiporter subunit F